VLSRVRGDDAPLVCALLLRSIVLSLESRVAELRVDVVSYPYELLIVVSAGEEDNGDADEI
jgi:hypothetical protein